MLGWRKRYGLSGTVHSQDAADWDNNLMGELLHPHRHEYPDDFTLYWLRQMRIFYWDWRSKFLVAVETDTNGKEVRVAGYAHWERKGRDGIAKNMTLWWFDPSPFRLINNKRGCCFTSGVNSANSSEFQDASSGHSPGSP